MTPQTDPKEMEIPELPDKEFKIIALKKLRKLQENADKRFNKICKIIPEQNEQFNKEIENIKKNIKKHKKEEICELKLQCWTKICQTELQR